MVSNCTLRSAAFVAATFLVTACDDLLPGRRQPPVAVAASDSAPAKPRPKLRDAVAREPADGPTAQAAFRDISQTLRRLVAAEQSFFAENGTYSADLAKVGFRPFGASQVEFLWVTKDGWAARATHPAIPGRDCVTFTGGGGPVPATRRLNRSGREGVVACDFVFPAQLVRRPAPPPRNAAPAAPAPAAPAQAPAPTPVVVDTTNALDAVDPVVQMRVDLKKLALAQTAYFGTQGTFSRRVETLPLQYGWQRGVSVTLINADQRSWTARAIHQTRPGRSCVVWFGKPLRRPMTANEQKTPEHSGEPACDR